MRDPYFRETRHKVLFGEFGVHDSGIVRSRGTLDTRIYSNKIIDIEEICDYGEGYVYDFTTENHHFSAGIGTIVVHNTDSVFLRLT
jgi:hypothetical protein